MEQHLQVLESNDRSSIFDTETLDIRAHCKTLEQSLNSETHSRICVVVNECQDLRELARGEALCKPLVKISVCI